jgi:small-conductance mechanosensitive channel
MRASLRLPIRLLMASILVLTVFVAQGQTSFAQGDAIVETTTPIDTITKDVDSLEKTLSIVLRLTSFAGTDDESLVGARVKLQKIVLSTSDLIKTIDQLSAGVVAKITDIGPPPEDSAFVEPQTIKDTREKLNQQKASLAVLKTDMEEIVLKAQAAVDEITRLRQEVFTEALSKRTSLTMALIKEAGNGVLSEVSSAKSLVSNWLQFVAANKFWQAFGSGLISLATALFLSFNFNRFFAAYLERKRVNPDYFTRVFTAFWGTILPSAATAIFLFATYLLFSYFGIFNEKISMLIFWLFLAISGTVFAWNLCRQVFAPVLGNWRLIEMSGSAARKMFWLSFCLFVIYALDTMLEAWNSALSGPLAITVIQGVIAANLIGVILILMALVNPAAARDEEANQEKSARVLKWPRWITIPVILTGVVIIVSALLGYIGFARFVSQQVVVTGAIIAIMWIGILAARELSSEGVLASTSIGRAMILRGYEPERVEQVSLMAGALFILFILLIGIPAILMQWGTRQSEILAFAESAFTGIDIGNFRFSLSAILVGIAIFVAVVFFTRMVQRWLSRSVFPRSGVDQGVSDSIRAGIGYFGFAVAALLAITSAGFDLSSLAIVAGALSLGIGFGLQNIVSNFVSGLILLVERPIKVGDWIIVGAAEGYVKRISVRATEIETFQRQSIIVPNSELINSQVTNWTFKSKSGRVDIAVGVAYGSDGREVEKILYEIAHGHAMVAKKPEPSVLFADFGPSSLDFVLRMFLGDISNTPVVQTEVRFEIMRRFAEAGIEIPFPQRDMNIKFPPGAERLFPLLESDKPSRTTRARKTGASEQSAKKD